MSMFGRRALLATGNKWFLSDGISPSDVVAAWQSINVASQVVSYTDLSINSNTLSSATPPAWATGTGWTGNGATTYLQFGDTSTTGFIHSTGVFSLFFRASLADYTADAAAVLFGSTITTAESGCLFYYENRTSQGSPSALRAAIYKSVIGTSVVIASEGSFSADNNNHVWGVVGNGSALQFWYDGSKLGSSKSYTSAVGSGNSTHTPYIMASNGSSIFEPLDGTMQAGFVSDTNITDAQALALSTAMAAL